MENQIVVFNLANEYYGVQIAAVQSIIKLQPITVVPRAPHFIEGVINLRGQVLPVMDLRKRLGLPMALSPQNTRIMVVEVATTLVGMVVDSVTEVLRLDSATIEPLSPLVVTVDSAFITGIAKIGARLIILLDLGQVLTLQEKADLTPLAG